MDDSHCVTVQVDFFLCKGEFTNEAQGVSKSRGVLRNLSLELGGKLRKLLRQNHDFNTSRGTNSKLCANWGRSM